MSNIKFELISLDRLKRTRQTDWKLCFICQIEKKRKLQNPFSIKVTFIYCIILQYFITLKLLVYLGMGVKGEGLLTVLKEL